MTGGIAGPEPDSCISTSHFALLESSELQPDGLSSIDDPSRRFHLKQKFMDSNASKLCALAAY
jgi:hypothetical protein